MRSIIPEQNDIASILMSFAHSSTSSNSSSNNNLSSSGEGGLPVEGPYIKPEPMFLSGQVANPSISECYSSSLAAIVEAAKAESTVGESMDGDSVGDYSGSDNDSGGEEDTTEDNSGSVKSEAVCTATSAVLVPLLRGKSSQKEMEDRRKERNRIHAKKARARKKKMLAEVYAVRYDTERFILFLIQFLLLTSAEHRSAGEGSGRAHQVSAPQSGHRHGLTGKGSFWFWT